MVGNADAISSLTFLPGYLNDGPKSPDIKSSIYPKYCCHRGRFRSYFSSKAIRTSGGTALSAEKGPPGALWIKIKVIVITPNKTGIAWSNRNAANLIITLYRLKGIGLCRTPD